MQEGWKKRRRGLEESGGVWCMSQGCRGKINICVASVHLPGVHDFLATNGAYPKWQKVRARWIRREAALCSCCLSAGDPWDKGLRRRDQRQTKKRSKAVREQLQGEKDRTNDPFLSPSISASFIPLSFAWPFCSLGQYPAVHTSQTK